VLPDRRLSLTSVHVGGRAAVLSADLSIG
jgi:hypothetical protein